MESQRLNLPRPLWPGPQATNFIVCFQNLGFHSHRLTLIVATGQDSKSSIYKLQANNSTALVSLLRNSKREYRQVVQEPLPLQVPKLPMCSNPPPPAPPGPRVCWAWSATELVTRCPGGLTHSPFSDSVGLGCCLRLCIF